MKKLETTHVAPGGWIVVSGHNPEDLNPHFIKVGNNDPLPALFEGNRMMVRCPAATGGRATVFVDEDRVGVVMIEGE
jgi:hypothetical protein